MRGRDLIEAGLSEPAGWLGALWGLWLCRLVGDADHDLLDGDQLGVAEIAPAVGTVMVASERTGSDGLTAVTPGCRLPGGSSDKAIRSGALGCRCRQPGGRMPAAHELSCQKHGRRGSDRGSVPRVIIGPPQQGQRSSGLPVVTCDAGAAGWPGG